MIRPVHITWSQYREGRRWQWKMRTSGFLWKRTAVAAAMRGDFIKWWSFSPAANAIKQFDDFRLIAEEAARREEQRSSHNHNME